MLYHGYIKFDTKNILPIINKTKITNNKIILEGIIQIISPIPVNIQIGEINCILESGNHLIPDFHKHHQLKILSDNFSNSSFHVYSNCILDSTNANIFDCIKYYSTHIYTIRCSNDNSPIVFNYGQCYSANEEIYLSNNPTTPGIYFFEYKWLKIKTPTQTENNDISKIIYTEFIYHENSHLIINDNELLELLRFCDGSKHRYANSTNSCVCVSFVYSNYEKIKLILKSKYNIDLVLSIPIARKKKIIYKFDTYEQALDKVNQHNSTLKMAEQNNLIQFTILNTEIFDEKKFNDLLTY